MTGSPFRTRTVVVLAIAGGVSLVAGFLWSVFGPEISTAPSSSHDAFSRSAVGHRALVELLRALDIPVETSRVRTAAKAERASLLVVAEPNLDERPDGEAVLRGLLSTKAPVLLVLPKWHERTAGPGRVEEVWWRDVGEVSRVLHQVEAALAIVRPAKVASWRTRGGVEGTPEVARPQLLARSRLAGFEPLVASDEGAALVGRLERDDEPDVTIVADPDLLEVHGLHRGDNAAIVVGLVEAARRGDGPVVVDETLHGHEYDPSVFRELFRWPLVLATVMAALASAFWLWSGIGRFGAPLRLAPDTDRGTRELVARTAELLHRGGHGAHVLSRYLASSIQEVARTTQAPPGLSGPALDEWLAHLEAARSPATTLAVLRRRVGEARLAGPRDARRLVGTAGAIHAWRREMTHGAVGGS